eukprot:1662626-Prymnesium_polylepis.1
MPGTPDALAFRLIGYASQKAAFIVRTVCATASEAGAAAAVPAAPACTRLRITAPSSCFCLAAQSDDPPDGGHSVKPAPSDAMCAANGSGRCGGDAKAAYRAARAASPSWAAYAAPSSLGDG